MSTPIDPICLRCVHFRPFSGGCDAFPDGIPDEILVGDDDHSKPLPGQGNDVTFEAGVPREAADTQRA
jgi:hypothetical protein